MTNITILEIQNELITSEINRQVIEVSKFCEQFKDRVISLVISNIQNESLLYNIIMDINNDYNTNDIVVEIHKLNHFAKNRLITNFEEEKPELTLTIMGSSEDSKLIKIWKKDVKRTN
jgi:hypothetical protein